MFKSSFFGSKKEPVEQPHTQVYYGMNTVDTASGYYTPNPFQKSSEASAAAKVGNALGDALDTTGHGLMKSTSGTWKLCKKGGQGAGDALKSGFKACKKQLGA